jgi:PLP dependent protein
VVAADALAERLAQVRSGVVDAAREAGRDPEEVTTIVVTKFHPASLIQQLVSVGVRDIGENRHQEARAKAIELAAEPIRWHFVGQLQRKKARQVREYATVVHSIDRSSLVDALGGAPIALDCFVQVNLTDDPARGGVDPRELDALVEAVVASDGLSLLGLMAVAPIEAEPRRAFARVRELGERIRRIAPDASALSMGMSEDYRDAVLEGATHLRIGTAITGNRPIPG